MKNTQPRLSLKRDLFPSSSSNDHPTGKRKCNVQMPNESPPNSTVPVVGVCVDLISDDEDDAPPENMIPQPDSSSPMEVDCIDLTDCKKENSPAKVSTLSDLLKKKKKSTKISPNAKKLEQKTVAVIPKVFSNFFIKKKKDVPETGGTKRRSTPRFLPFEVKERMLLADTHRVVLDSERLQKLDKCLRNRLQLPNPERLYLAQLKSVNYKVGHSENTRPSSDNADEDDVIMVHDSSSVRSAVIKEKPKTYRCKFLQFREDRRPAFYGTWRKRSSTVTARNPFNKDDILQYDVDSEEEWEDDPEGESIHDSDDEKESVGEYEIDNDLFVPHGYLSDEEAQMEEDADPSNQKLKLAVLESQFNEERKENFKKLKTRMYGCIWIGNDVSEGTGASSVENLLLNFRAVWNRKEVPFVVGKAKPCTIPTVTKSTENNFPEYLLPTLIKLVHESTKRNDALCKEFKGQVERDYPGTRISLACIKRQIKQVSRWVPLRGCRIVEKNIREKYNSDSAQNLENENLLLTVVRNVVNSCIGNSNADADCIVISDESNDQMESLQQVSPVIPPSNKVNILIPRRFKN